MAFKTVSFKKVYDSFYKKTNGLEKPVRIPTLGRTSYFDVWCFANKLLFRGKTGNEFICDRTFWIEVSKRMRKLPVNERWRGTYYTLDHWKETPNTGWAPNVPAVYKYLMKE